MSMQNILIQNPNIIQIKQSISQFKNEVTKFLNNPYHSIRSISQLHGKLEKLESKLLDEDYKPNSLSNPQHMFLPVLQKYNKNPSMKFVDKLDELSENQSNFNSKDKSLFDNPNRIFHIKKKNQENDGITKRKALHKDKMFEDNIIKKYGINKNDEQPLNSERERKSFSHKKLHGRASAHPSFRKADYNSFNKPILNKEDFKGGLFEMVNRGLIPKNADLSLAFSKDGNPFKLPVIEEKKRNISALEIDSDLKKTDSVFLTAAKNNKVITSNITINENIDLNNDQFKEVNNNVNSNSKNSNYLQTHTSNKELKENSEDMFKFLIFKDFKIQENRELTQFKKKNLDKWSVLNYLIGLLEKLFKSLNITLAEVDCGKLKKLATDELKTINKMDLINCLSDHDIKIKGFNKASKLFSTVKDSASVIIQKIIKGFIVRRRFNKMKNQHKKICKIQTIYRLYRIINISKNLIQDKLNSNMVQWQIMMQEFKENWASIKFNKRTEIHINSLSLTSDVTCTIGKFNEKENNQLSRLISLKDPNIEIIYISPFELSEDVINYYFSILSTLGITNIKQRVHFIVPDTIGHLPQHYSLSALLFYSTSSCKQVMELIQGKQAYIVPGRPSTIDIRLSLYLECPIMYIENEASNVLFTKSGAKRVFEICELATPIGEWDIRSKDSLFSSLAKLITDYSSIDVWVLKIDNEFGGRGTAYFQINRSKHLLDRKKERQQGVISSDVFESQVKEILKTSLNKKMEIISKNLHKCGEDFINELCRIGGIIEACPTYLLSGILGSPAVSFLIEPDGNINEYISYDKICSNYFSTIAAISPQTSIQNLVIFLIRMLK